MKDKQIFKTILHNHKSRIALILAAVCIALLSACSPEPEPILRITREPTQESLPDRRETRSVRQTARVTRTHEVPNPISTGTPTSALPTETPSSKPKETEITGDFLTEDQNLATASELVSSCLNWPQDEISTSNNARLMTGLTKGQPAVDFSLQDVKGNIFSLSELLENKPVLLVLGGFT